MPETLTGSITRIVFRNNENGWTVLEIQTTQTGEEHTVVGVLPTCAPGEQVEFTGSFTEHSSYGVQFKATNAVSLAPATLGALETYLGSGLIKGIGAAMARRIVTEFGMDTLYIMENEPEKLTKIAGIGIKSARVMAESFYEQRVMRDVMIGLQEFGVTINQAVKLHKLYGANCLTKVQENPYSLIDDIEGIGFKIADAIAQRAGFAHDSSERIMSGVKYVLRWARQDAGHTFLPRLQLIEVAAKLLGAPPDTCAEALDTCILRGDILYHMVGEVDGVFLPALHFMEVDVAKRLLSLDETVHEIIADDDALGSLEGDLSLRLAPMQWKAVNGAFDNGAFVITGGPGTGKTTILKFIINLLTRLSMDFVLCAPTGRAAKRMEEATGADAYTIHRLLEYTGEGGRWGRDEENPLLYDMVIVDEMSMVDVPLMQALLKAIAPGTRLLMVGDVDQIPPVGAGNVLRDIIESDTVPVVRLTDIFRQSDRSGIVVNAHRINMGQYPKFDAESDFTFEEYSWMEGALSRVVELCTNGSSALGLNDPRADIQVLAPMKKGVLGVRNLNMRLQAAMNPKSANKPEKEYGDMVFRLGDKVMQIKNDYKLEWTREENGKMEFGVGVFNGDMGTLYRIDNEERSVWVLFDDARLAIYGFNQLDMLELAYCISIHKSQGSEFPAVVLPLVQGPPMLMTRNLLYTAITRARHRAVIVGRYDTVCAMVDKEQSKKRYSSLKVRLTEIAQLMQDE